ncbi:MAG: amidohydrolase family protein [Sphingomonadales bacterium]
MKKFLPFFAVIILFFSPLSVSAQEGERIAITNVTVLLMQEDQVFENAIVFISEGEIYGVFSMEGFDYINDEGNIHIEEEVEFLEPFEANEPISNFVTRLDDEGIKELEAKLGYSLQPDPMKIIDGTGKFLIPGLAEMHGHIPDATSYNQNLEDLLFLFLSNGVTTVRGMLGNDGQLKLQQDILEGKILGPTLYLGSPSFRGNSVTSPLQARKKVRDHVAEGWDFLKIHPGLTLNEYNAMAEEATKAGITWGGHIPSDVGLWRALEAGQSTIDHLDGYELFTGTVTFNGFSGTVEGYGTGPVDQELLNEAVRITLEAGAVIVPTNALWSVLVGGVSKQELEARPEMKYASPAERRSWASRHTDNRNNPQTNQIIENRRQILKALYDGGVPILLGSDAPQLFSVPGFSIPREMENMAAAGIDNLGILAAGTINVGEFFKDKDAFGQIAPGQRADLILLNANPLEDISNIRDIAGVMVRGIWISKEDIDARLTEIAARRKN